MVMTTTSVAAVGTLTCKTKRKYAWQSIIRHMTTVPALRTTSWRQPLQDHSFIWHRRYNLSKWERRHPTHLYMCVCVCVYTYILVVGGSDYDSYNCSLLTSPSGPVAIPCIIDLHKWIRSADGRRTADNRSKRKGKGTAFPLEAWTGPLGSRRLRLQNFYKIGTWRWQGCQPYAPAGITEVQGENSVSGKGTR